MKSIDNSVSFKAIVCSLIQVALLYLVVSCDSVVLDTSKPVVRYTVTFDSQGGTAVAAQTVANGGLVMAPTTPYRSGFTFGGWFKESACTNAWTFSNEAVISNITLFAKWIAEVVTYKVTYQAAAGYAYVVLTVDSGSLLTPLTYEPSDGYTFTGWFKDNALTTLWDFSTEKVTKNLVLYYGQTLNFQLLTTKTTTSAMVDGYNATIETFGTEDTFNGIKVNSVRLKIAGNALGSDILSTWVTVNRFLISGQITYGLSVAIGSSEWYFFEYKNNIQLKFNENVSGIVTISGDTKSDMTSYPTLNTSSTSTISRILFSQFGKTVNKVVVRFITDKGNLDIVLPNEFQSALAKL